ARRPLRFPARVAGERVRLRPRPVAARGLRPVPAEPAGLLARRPGAPGLPRRRLRVRAPLLALGLRLGVLLPGLGPLRPLFLRVLGPFGALLLRLAGNVAAILVDVLPMVLPVVAGIVAVFVVSSPGLFVKEEPAAIAVPAVVVVVVDGGTDR